MKSKQCPSKLVDGGPAKVLIKMSTKGESNEHVCQKTIEEKETPIVL